MVELEVRIRIKLMSWVATLRSAIETSTYYLFSPLILILKRLLRKSSDNDSILIIERILRIGDTITAMPAIRAIKRIHKGQQIVRLVNQNIKPLLTAIGNDENTIYFADGGFYSFIKQCMDIRRMNFKHAYILVTDRTTAIFSMLTGIPHTTGFDYNKRGVFFSNPISAPDFINKPAFNYRSNSNIYNIKHVWLKLIDRTLTDIVRDTKFTYYIDAESREWAKRRISHLKRPIILFHPPSLSSSKLWMKERWVELGKNLMKKEFSIVISSGMGEHQYALDIAHKLRVECLAGETNIPRLFALIDILDGVITVDTSIGHIASLLGKPAVVLFGPSDERIWEPDGINTAIVKGDTFCKRCKKPSCFQRRHLCMETITVEMVEDALLRVIK
ncbi:MAG: hypothetical protein DRH51_02095 [Candidatus Coatesbacteria bacterium]|nr:MAG: hypothetical protein DRH51_02095 [Candidatus Coatesbacteria bacterium]